MFHYIFGTGFATGMYAGYHVGNKVGKFGAERKLKKVKKHTKDILDVVQGKTAEVANKVADTTAKAAETVAEAAGTMADKAAPTAVKVKDTVVETAGNVVETAGKVAHVANTGGKAAAKGLWSRLNDGLDSLADKWKSEPTEETEPEGEETSA